MSSDPHATIPSSDSGRSHARDLRKVDDGGHSGLNAWAKAEYATRLTSNDETLLPTGGAPYANSDVVMLDDVAVRTPDVSVTEEGTVTTVIDLDETDDQTIMALSVQPETDNTVSDDETVKTPADDTAVVDNVTDDVPEADDTVSSFVDPFDEDSGQRDAFRFLPDRIPAAAAVVGVGVGVFVLRKILRSR